MGSDPIEGYIERVTALQRADQGVVDLRAIATELGISEHELQRAEHAAVLGQARGRHFVEHRLWDDAVRELSTVAALRPYDPEALYELAAAHHGRWLTLRDPGDLAAARTLASRCVELDANFVQGYWLLEQLALRTRTWRLPRQALWLLGFPLATVLLASLWAHPPTPRAPEPFTADAELATSPRDAAASPMFTCEVVSRHVVGAHIEAVVRVTNKTGRPVHAVVNWRAGGKNQDAPPGPPPEPEITPTQFVQAPGEVQEVHVVTDLPRQFSHMSITVIGKVIETVRR